MLIVENREMAGVLLAQRGPAPVGSVLPEHCFFFADDDDDADADAV